MRLKAIHPLKKSILIILSGMISLFYFSCNTNNRNSYAIRDFEKTLQPYLIKIVSQGIVGYDTATNYVRQCLTDKELERLSKSEHPVLRSLAFREMLERPTFNHFDLIMNNLDDTAIVATDAGEWVIRYLRVSDDMLQHGRWKDTVAKKETIRKIILEHNYLSSAYNKVSLLSPDPAYYHHIKEMTLRERYLFDDFEQTENALFALAKYKKGEDIHLIKELILSNKWRITGTSFDLMREYPHETYLEIYEDYFPRTFYRQSCENQNTDIAISFFKSIAIYKNKRSEKILHSILDRSPFMPCPIDTNHLKRNLIYSIWNNPCDAYINIRNKVERSVKHYEENDKLFQTELPPIEFDSTLSPNDNLKEPIRWWN